MIRTARRACWSGVSPGSRRALTADRNSMGAKMSATALGGCFRFHSGFGASDSRTINGLTGLLRITVDFDLRDRSDVAGGWRVR